MAERNEFGQFLPGQSGNPGGRAKNRKVTESLKRLMELTPEARAKYKPINGYEELALGLIKSATSGDGKFQQKVHAQALVYDRIEGKPEISESEAEAMKGQRMIVMDMPSPPADPLPEEVKKPN